MTVSLQTHQENQVLTFSNFKKDSYVFAFDVHVRSGNFSAMLAMTHYDSSWLDDFLRDLNRLADSTAAVATLHDEQSSTISFTLDHLGHMTVRGELNEFTQVRQSLNFAFVTDQTCLTPFIADLKKALSS